MRFVSLTLVASLAALTGCAATPEATDTAASDVIVAPDVESLVGNYEYSGVPSEFGEFVALTLNADGSYSAEVDSQLVNPRQRCVTAPCTATEVGTYKVVRPADANFVTLIVTPKHNLAPGGNAPRSYRVQSSDAGKALTLKRRLTGRDPGGFPVIHEIVSKLFVAKLPPPVCLAFPTCQPHETELEPGQSCGLGQECHVVSMCGHSITCATSMITCLAFPSCGEGEEQLLDGQTCGFGQECRVVSMCGHSITCAKQ